MACIPIHKSDSNIAKHPTYRVDLFSHHTPLETFDIGSENLGGKESPIVRNKFKFFIKRDDQTGFEYSGNKIRKLEYILGYAKKHNYDTIVTCGSKQSNWCRSVACVCKRLGFKNVHLLLTSENEKDSKNFGGNYLFAYIYGAKIHIVPKSIQEKSTDTKDIRTDLIVQLAQYLEKKSNVKALPIVCAGSDEIGIWGYINMIESELINQIQQSMHNKL